MNADALVQALPTLSQYGLSAWAVASNFLILIILFLLFYCFLQYIGRGPFVAIILAFYCAYAVYLAFPYMSFLPSAPKLTALLTHVGLYAVLVFIFYMILRRVAASDFVHVGILGILLLPFLASAFLMAMAYHVFLIPSIYNFPTQISVLFAPDQFFFWWFISPAIGLFFLAQ